jgi:hypothetical protein
MFVGYDEHSKAFRCYNPKTKKNMVLEDIKFDENVMGFHIIFPTKEMVAKPTKDTTPLSLLEEPGIDARWPREGTKDTQLGEDVLQDVLQGL